MKKLILTLTILFSISINAQYAIISAVDIKEGADEGYLKLEEFFGPIHDATIEAGVQNSQTVFKVTSEGQNSDYPDYIIITGFSSKEQLAAYNESWSGDAWTNFARRVYREIGNEILKKKNMENYKSAGKIYVSSLGKFNQTILSILDMFNLYYLKKTTKLRERNML